MKNNVELTKKLLDFVNGELLGDGCIYVPDKKYAKSAQYQHSTKHKEYLEWLRIELDKLGIEISNMGIRKQEKKSFGKYHIGYHYTSKSYRELISLRRKWYPQNKKIVPSNIEITPITLRQWYIGDGNLNRYKRSEFIIPQIKLYTYAFSMNNVNMLVNKLINLGIESKMLIQKPREDGGSGPYIRIKSSSSINFFEYIGDCPSGIQNIYGYKWPTNDEMKLMVSKKEIEKCALKSYKDKNWLRNRYWSNEKTTRDIANECSVAKSTIIKWLDLFKIRKRDNHTYMYETTNIGNETYRDRDWLYNKYIKRNMSMGEIAINCDVTPNTILNWLRNFNIDTRSKKCHSISQ